MLQVIPTSLWTDTLEVYLVCTAFSFAYVLLARRVLLVKVHGIVAHLLHHHSIAHKLALPPAALFSLCVCCGAHVYTYQTPLKQQNLRQIGKSALLESCEQFAPKRLPIFTFLFGL